MTIKVALLKSGEEVISDFKEVYKDDQFLGYYFNDPYVLKIEKYQTVVGDDSRHRVKIKFLPWLTLSKEKRILIFADWVVTFYEPVDTVMDSYLNRIKEIEEDEDGEDDQVSVIEEPEVVSDSD